MSQCPRGEMLAWFSVRMFEQACINNRLQIVRMCVRASVSEGNLFGMAFPLSATTVDTYSSNELHDSLHTTAASRRPLSHATRACSARPATSDASMQMRYMVNHGLDVGFHAVSEAVHWVVGGCDEALGGRDVVPALGFLVSEAGMPVSAQV